MREEESKDGAGEATRRAKRRAVQGGSKGKGRVKKDKGKGKPLPGAKRRRKR